MFITNEIYRINNLHKLIQCRHTGTPLELADSLRISKRQLYNVLDELKELGAEIGYSRSGYTFYYKNVFDMDLHCKIYTMSAEDEIKVESGYVSKHFLTFSLEKNPFSAIFVH